jgi:hypothetical protein
MVIINLDSPRKNNDEDLSFLFAVERDDHPEEPGDQQYSRPMPVAKQKLMSCYKRFIKLHFAIA